MKKRIVLLGMAAAMALAAPFAIAASDVRPADVITLEAPKVPAGMAITKDLEADKKKTGAVFKKKQPSGAENQGTQVASMGMGNLRFVEGFFKTKAAADERIYGKVGTSPVKFRVGLHERAGSALASGHEAAKVHTSGLVHYFMHNNIGARLWSKPERSRVTGMPGKSVIDSGIADAADILRSPGSSMPPTSSNDTA